MIQEFALIEDGYAVTTVIPRVAGIHPAVKLTYRPALYEERLQFTEDVGRLAGGLARSKACAELIGRHVQSWDVQNQRKQPVEPKNLELVKRLQPALLDKILDAINGYRAIEEADDAKNSSTGSGSGA